MPAMKFDAIEPNLKRARNTNGSVSEREGNEDRLSDLPDCVLIHLLEFLTTKDAVRTTLLSKRWKDLWKRVPSLRLRSTDPEFRHMTLFKKFVNKVLSFRDGSAPLHSLDFCYNGLIPPTLLIRVVKYAKSHRIEQLRLNIDSGGIELPPCLFSIQTITWLDLSVPSGEALGLLPKFLNMTALMSLRLRRFAFSAGDGELVDPFSGCIKLKTLVIEHYVVKVPHILCISNVTLTNLTIHSSPFHSKEAYEIVLSTPSLRSFAYRGVISQKISSKSNLSFLEEVNIDVPKSLLSSRLHSPFILISWLQLLANVRSLTVSSCTLEILSKIPDLVNTESPCLDNLKSLIVKVQKFRRPVKLHKAELQLSSPRIDGAVDFLIRNSLFPEVTIVDY
ncbi:hypothetical protein HN51_018589 [Arachis hypogaea]|uniref:F-box/FBD/LRR-repeat protein At4g13965 n=2 Tax=Arachis TaxID=3817 RepID=A0A6P4C129_ARADU|nr:putative F-box/FBD/LRR-repeat protein At4g13965 [Arachis duranensis]XP_025613245.1 putative F-box/FBD/LRR-repeat protein At4g13965 isoform X1 [Arachis hypogaea]XP_025613246.1 putative F-box/FBD/LRR-repeat protein At4g13965 isoform X1 [Arachis hypogaea]XP_052108509.1 putative F-box/FBD/LRR-repeat protein At4g13965 [Arachis duranensis]QHO30191.1 F-box/FBD/LRR-repeat protein [Arachis hypogaea]QHO30192.1 F-box/FBD/LRR-repeat protein [Arachis hypogaea]RYR42119.1 hypothetical protein Ahy_A08g038